MADSAGMTEIQEGLVTGDPAGPDGQAMSTAAAGNASAGRTTTHTIGDPAALGPLREAWDALADLRSKPYCTSDWLLAWWRHARPASAWLAVVVVLDRDDGTLVGLAPFFCDRGPAGAVRWRPLGTQTCQHVEPLALPGREAEVARQVALALHRLAPRPSILNFEGIAATSPWPRLLADAWPARRRLRPRIVQTGAGEGLAIDLAGRDVESWLGERSSNFRRQLRKSRKTVLGRGGGERLSDATSAGADIEAFVRLHNGRWEDRGGSAAMSPAVARMLHEAAPAMIASGRMRLWSVDLDGDTIASIIVVRAGSTHSFWLSGFDERHARLKPSYLSLLQAIEDAVDLGAERFDLGEGIFAYKLRFTDDVREAIVRVAVVPVSPRLGHAAMALAPSVGRRFAASHLTGRQRRRARSLLRRVADLRVARPGRRPGQAATSARAAAGAVTAAGALVGEVVTDPAALTGCLAAWDSLVAVTSQPYCSAAWLLGWWRHAAPAGAQLGVVVVREGSPVTGPIVGIAPGFFDRTRLGLRRWRPLGAHACQRVQPMAHPGREADVAVAIRRALASHPCRPDVLTFEGVPASSPWPALLARRDDAPVPDGEPGRARVMRIGATIAPGMRLAPATFDDWLARKSAHFRQRLRRDRRTVAKQGYVLRRATEAQAPAAVETFLAQHTARWKADGGSSAITPGVAALLRDAGPELVRTGTLQLWVLEVEGRTIATRLLFAAGDEVGAWLSSYDPEHAKLRPSMVTMLGAVEAVFEQGAARFDLGEGVFDYKLRFSDHEQTLLRLLVVLPTDSAPARARVALGLAPVRAHRVVSEHLPDARKAQLRSLIGGRR